MGQGEEASDTLLFDITSVTLYGRTVYKTTKEYGRTWYHIFYDPAVKEYLESDSCCWILIGTSKRSAPQALEAYRKRGEVELNFDDLKRTVSKIEEKDRHYWSASDMLDKGEEQNCEPQAPQDL